MSKLNCLRATFQMEIIPKRTVTEFYNYFCAVQRRLAYLQNIYKKTKNRVPVFRLPCLILWQNKIWSKHELQDSPAVHVLDKTARHDELIPYFRRIVWKRGSHKFAHCWEGCFRPKRSRDENWGALQRKKIDLERDMLRIGSKEVSGIPRHPGPRNP